MTDDATFPMKYIEQMKIIEESILDLLDAEDPQNKDYEKINKLINDIELEYKNQNSSEILHLLIAIAENHQRTPNFMGKMVSIIKPIIANMENINVNSIFVQEIINNGGINYDIKELTPLFMAIELDNIEIVKLLLEHKNIDVNKRSLKVFYYNYLKYSCDYNYGNFDDYEDDYDDDYNEDDDHYYKKMIRKRSHFYGKKEYEENEYDDEEHDEFYLRDSERSRMYRGGGVKTPLQVAIELKNVPLIQLLLSHQKIDVNKRSIIYKPYKKFVITPLYEACQQKNEEIKELLLSNKNILENKKSSFYEEERKKDLKDKRVFELDCEKTPFDKNST